MGRVVVDARLRGPAGTLRELLDGSLSTLLAGSLVGSSTLCGLAGLALLLLGKLGGLAGNSLLGGLLDGVRRLSRRVRHGRRVKRGVAHIGLDSRIVNRRKHRLIVHRRSPLSSSRRPLGACDLIASDSRFLPLGGFE